MKLYFSPRAQELLENSETGPFMKSVLQEALDYGLDKMRLSNYPFYLQAKSSFWWVPFCSLAIFHHKESEYGEYALLFENPLHPESPNLGSDYFDALLEHSQEMTVV